MVLTLAPLCIICVAVFVDYAKSHENMFLELQMVDLWLREVTK